MQKYKSTIITIAVVIIALSMGYLALDKYQERREKNRVVEMFFGTSDSDEIQDLLEKSREQMKKTLDSLKNSFK